MTTESATAHTNPAATHQHGSHGFAVFGGVARVTAASPADAQVAAGFVTDFLQSLADECLDRGADLIGHLKVHLSTAHGTVRASLVDPEAGPALAVDPPAGRSLPVAAGQGRSRGAGGQSEIRNPKSEIDPSSTGEMTVNAVVHGLDNEAVAASVYAAAHSAAAAGAGGLTVEWETPLSGGRSEQ